MLKVPTLNYLSPYYTASDNLKRIHWITGKGGVGKSLYSVALTKYLHNKNGNTQYVSAENSPPIELLKQLNTPFLELSTETSTELYIGIKFRSKLLAKGIMNTPFFKSIFNILPSLGNLMFLGHLVHLLEKDPTLTIVVDMPASGHARTLIESSFLFEKIFKTGIIFKDIINIHNFFYQQANMQLTILTLPTLMAIEETLELKESLEQRGLKYITLALNNLLHQASYTENCLPKNLAKKIEQEKEIITKFDSAITNQFAYCGSLVSEDIVSMIITKLEEQDG